MQGHTISTLFPFFFNDTATTEIYTLSLHDALPILALDPSGALHPASGLSPVGECRIVPDLSTLTALPFAHGQADRKSTRLNSSHANISYAVFCLKKNNTRHYIDHPSALVHKYLQYL